jgi:class 3 adenylate cyclase
LRDQGQFVGDGLMAFWTAPFSRGESHATDARRATLAQQCPVRKVRDRLSDVLERISGILCKKGP